MGHVRHIVGVQKAEQIELETGAQVRDLLHVLADRHGDKFRQAVFETGEEDLKSNFIMTINGVLLNQLQGLRSPLRDGDLVVIMPIVSGG